MRRGTDDGFSLIEVLLAAAILSTALASLAMLMPRALDATRVAGERATATALARDKLEELFAVSTVPASSGEDIVSTRASGAFVRRWQVSPVDGNVALAAIRVEVHRRTSVNGLERTSLATLLAIVR